MTVVTITRCKDPLAGERVQVLRRWQRKNGGVDLLVVLPNGRKRLVPQAWTDADPTAAGTDVDEDVAATLATVQDLSAAAVIVSALSRRAAGEQAASQSACEEDNDAACPAQSAPGAVLDATAGGAGRASRGRRGRSDHAVGAADREGGRSRGRGGR